MGWVRGKCIGGGAFATVSLAVDDCDGRVFAVKSVDIAACAPSQLAALENEIRILRALSAPHSVVPFVLPCLGDDLTRESPATFRNLHLDYLPAGTLADLASRGGVDEPRLRSLARCVATALFCLHSRGILHCDVKGSNVLLGSVPGTAVLADFGSAVDVSGGSAPVLPRGSPLWMAPEVVRGESQGPASDVWSLGCTVIEVAGGGKPWEGRGADTLRRIGFSDELPEFPALLSELGRDFLDKCLRRDPAERWSCDRLLRHPFLASFPVGDKVTYRSPRCVLDCPDAEFSDDGRNSRCSTPYRNSTHSFDDIGAAATHRICKLASNCDIIWESDGWETVRTRSRNRATEVAEAGGAAEEGGEGTTSEYSNSNGAEPETEGTDSEEYSSRRTSWGGLCDSPGGGGGRLNDPAAEHSPARQNYGSCTFIRDCSLNLTIKLTDSPIL